MADSLLSGYRALDLTDEKGYVCGKVLATLGVDVIKVEPPDGDPGRQIPPFYHNTTDGNSSLYWYSFNTDKRSITLNLKVARGRGLFRKLVAGADFVLESFRPGYMNHLKLGYPALSRVNPRIIVTSITPFGQKGPYRRYKGSELVASAMGGILGNIGEPDRPPLKEALDSCYFHAGVAAALGTITSHYYREITAEGQQVDVSIQEVAASRTNMNLVAWEYDKRLLKRSGPFNQFGINPFQWIWRCKDGYLYWQLMGGLFGAPANRALSQWIEEKGLENPLREITKWEELDIASMAKEKLDIWQRAIANFFAQHTKEEISREGLKRGINCCVANNAVDLMRHQQLLARNYWVGVEHSELGTGFKYPRHFLLSSETENYTECRAPFIGESNDEIYGKEMGLSGTEIAALKEMGVI
jgi:crotonobetainyl-CoA:carnitine CoA-transferase CaiB-like acyl-CoA transferase